MSRRSGIRMSRRSGIRKNTGLVLMTFGLVSSPVIHVAIFISVGIGVWWPIIQEILDSPARAFWLIPLGCFFSSLGIFFQSFIYGILAWPFIALTTWLLDETPP